MKQDMDMSYFRRKRIAEGTPDLAQLLARVAAGQAGSPTACSAALVSKDGQSLASESGIDLFIDRRTRTRKANASFNAEIASALITSGQSL